SRARARHRYSDRAGHPAGAELQGGDQFRRARRRLGAGLAGRAFSRARSRRGDAQADRRRRGRRAGARSGRPRRHYVSLLHHEPRRLGLRHLPPAGLAAGDARGGAVSVHKVFADALKQRILVLDGAMGTMIQALKLDEEGYRAARFDAWNREVRGNNDLLNLSRPGAVRAIHLAYFRAGADIVSTNTFSSTRIAQAAYGMSEIAYELNLEGAQLAREAARVAQDEDGSQRFVAGAIGPTNRTASISPDVLNPSFRAVTFDELRIAYGEQVRGLVDGGVDALLIET